MAKQKESKLIPFSTVLTEANYKALRKIAADKSEKLYEVVNTVIKKGLA